MFGDILNDLKSSYDEVRHGTATRTITVAKPYCAPARGIVMTALNDYGVNVFGYTEIAHMVSPLTASRVNRLPSDEPLPLVPSAQVARVTVSVKQAAWAEYLLLRTGKLQVVGRYVNRRNAGWAARHGGRMPPAWQDGQPWIEQSCSEGKNAWRRVIKERK